MLEKLKNRIVVESKEYKELLEERDWLMSNILATCEICHMTMKRAKYRGSPIRTETEMDLYSHIQNMLRIARHDTKDFYWKNKCFKQGIDMGNY